VGLSTIKGLVGGGSSGILGGSSGGTSGDRSGGHNTGAFVGNRIFSKWLFAYTIFLDSNF